MKKTKNTIRLTEQEFNTLISESVKRAIEEGKFGDFMKKAGKGVANTLAAGALGGSLAAGAIGTIAQEPKYSDTDDVPSEEVVMDYEDEISPFDGEVDDSTFNKIKFKESKLNNRIAQIIREEISKVL